MSEYIKREDAIKEIERFIGYLDDDMICRIKIALNRIPSADVAEVVRCRDCKQCKKSYNYGYYYCEHFGILRIWDEGVEGDRYSSAMLHPSSYCSYGERKDGERAIFIDETIDETCGYGEDGESE